MLGRIIEIGSDGCYLSLQRGFLVVSRSGDGTGPQERGRVALDDIAALIGNAYGLTYSNNVLVALAERGVPFVLCGAHHLPCGLLWPVDSYFRQGARLDAQLRASLPLRKRLWKWIVQSKIDMQAAALASLGRPSRPLRRLTHLVRVGDPGNVEGRAAALYWKAILGPAFRRDRSAPGANAMLNYGYTVLRSLVARYIMASGLHPGIPLHHANAANAMRLVDDLMEPFRPVVDLAVVRALANDPDAGVTLTVKRLLAGIAILNLPTPHGTSPLTTAVQRFVNSVGQVFEGAATRLDLPYADDTALTSLWAPLQAVDPTDEPPEAG